MNSYQHWIIITWLLSEASYFICQCFHTNEDVLTVATEDRSFLLHMKTGCLTAKEILKNETVQPVKTKKYFWPGSKILMKILRNLLGSRNSDKKLENVKNYSEPVYFLAVAFWGFISSSAFSPEGSSVIISSDVWNTLDL